MHAIHAYRSRTFGLAALLAATMLAPFSVGAENIIPAAAPAGPSWDETSGYVAGEASGMVALAPNAGSADTIDPVLSNSQERAIIARRALASGDLGSMQAQALADVVASGLNRGATRDDGAGEDLDAEHLAQFRAIELALSSSLGAAHQETSGCVSAP